MNLSKIFLDLYKQNLPVDIILNSILVRENVRNSFLFESALDTNTFPDFKFVDLIQNNYFIGKLITKNTEIDLGNFLSYPCAGDIVNNRNYYFDIDIIYNDELYQLIGMVCGKIKNLFHF